jgi:hypothetical protein
MIDFDALDRETRTVALVGSFLQRWASLETAIGTAIAAALKLTKLQEYILARNISFTYKLHILGALCTISRLEPDYKEYYRKVLNDIQAVYWRRNTVAHDLFAPSKTNDGVVFAVMRARGKVDFPDVDWSVSEFREAFTELDRLGLLMSDLGRIFKKQRPLYAESITT